MRSPLTIAASLSLLLTSLIACDGEKDDSGALNCTQIGCTDGLTLQMTASDPGEWTFELGLDGEAVTCTAILPFPESLVGLGCDDERVSLTFSGTALDDSEHELGDVWISTLPATVTFRALLDGVIIQEQTFTPTYIESAPNGEECGPICNNAAEVVGTL